MPSFIRKQLFEMYSTSIMEINTRKPIREYTGNKLFDRLIDRQGISLTTLKHSNRNNTTEDIS